MGVLLKGAAVLVIFEWQFGVAQTNCITWHGLYATILQVTYMCVVGYSVGGGIPQTRLVLFNHSKSLVLCVCLQDDSI